LPEIAQICNGKIFVDTDGKHIGENKKRSKTVKRAEKRKWVKEN
jgi:hypothetical protein